MQVPLELIQAAMVQAVPAQTPSGAAAEIFRNACVFGQLKLDPSQARILKPSETPDFAAVLDGSRGKESQTTIRFSYPRSTYLIFAKYKHVQARSVETVCYLVSDSISKDDATRVFLEGLPAGELFPAWVPNMYSPAWTADHPELGYRKSLKFRFDGSTVLSVGMYATKKTPGTDTKKK